MPELSEIELERGPVTTLTQNSCLEQLIVFARFPEPGKTKTRLIPGFGEHRAVKIYRMLAGKTIALAKRFAATRNCRLVVYFCGGDQNAMEIEFGGDVEFIEQSSGDLGTRLSNATDDAFMSGTSRVVVIGTDCFELREDHLEQAFNSLKLDDVVLGPAFDGGYFLVGLKHSQIPLFEGIEWSSSHVFEQSKLVIQRSGKTLHELEPLPDVDYPEDVIPLRRTSRNEPQGDLFECVPGRISVIIPTINEAAELPATLRAIGPRSETTEIIVVDGGSTDATIAIAEKYGAKVFMSKPGRARQMNAGAAVATGETLIFLHADTRLPMGFANGIEACLGQQVAAGAFRLSIAGKHLGLRIVEWGSNIRSKYFQMPYGDQALFMRTKTFMELEGYRNIAFMEDFEFIRRLSAVGKVSVVDQSVCTSGRRWRKRGIIMTTIVNQFCILAYKLGISPERIGEFYRQ